MGLMRLEEMALVKIGTTLWAGDEVKKLVERNVAGLINMEKAISLVLSSVSKFAISANLKKRLIDVTERTGYELYVFLTRRGTDCDFELGTIKWTTDGLICGSETMREFLRITRKYNFSEFRYCCELFDESLIRNIWGAISADDRQLHRQVNTCHVFSAYWTGILDDNLAFFEAFTPFIIGFKRSRSLEVNMLWHSIAVNNHAAIHYFRRRMRESDLVGLSFNESSEHEILELALKTPNDESFAYFLSFLEMPIFSESARELIVKNINSRSIKGILDHVLRRINIFGDLHYNIFRYLLFSLRHKWTIEVKDNLHFYALNLLSRGRLEKFDFLPDKNCKKILSRQIVHRLKTKRGLGIFVTIHWNNYTHLLSEFFEWLADNVEDEDLFREFVLALVDGRQYDL